MMKDSSEVGGVAGCSNYSIFCCCWCHWKKLKFMVAVERWKLKSSEMMSQKIGRKVNLSANHDFCDVVIPSFNTTQFCSLWLAAHDDNDGLKMYSKWNLNLTTSTLSPAWESPRHSTSKAITTTHLTHSDILIMNNYARKIHEKRPENFWISRFCDRVQQTMYMMMWNDHWARRKWSRTELERSFSFWTTKKSHTVKMETGFRFRRELAHVKNSKNFTTTKKVLNFVKKKKIVWVFRSVASVRFRLPARGAALISLQR